MDILSEILQTLKIKSMLSCTAELSAPWGLYFDPQPGKAGFFLVIRGSCVLQLTQFGHDLTLRGGDIVVLPRGDEYTIKDQPESEATPIRSICDTASHQAVLRHGGGGAQTTILAGCFHYDSILAQPFVSGFPALIHVAAENADPWIEWTMKFMANEYKTNTHGSQLIATRLSDVLFAQALRYHINNVSKCPETTGLLKGLSDPYISKALGLIHANPSAPWTVAKLALEVGISRSHMAQRFAEVTNTSPLQYITIWRMHLAAELMKDPQLNLTEIAFQVGYQSEAAFSKAFKRYFGIAPGVYRSQPTTELVAMLN